MTTEFADALRSNAAEFGVELNDETIEKLSAYHGVVMEHNALLHLVAPCSDAEFAVRHVLESLTMLELLPPNARIADVGPGAGLPSLPCIIARPDLKVELIESKAKKVAFLTTAIERLGLAAQARVVNRQFEEIERPPVSHVACRALDKFTAKLPRLLRWSRNAALLFYGGPTLRDELVKNRVEFTERLMPQSERRYLFIVEKRQIHR